jgi:FdrA protein
MPAWNFVVRSAWHDSVTLMGLTRQLEAVPGVRRAAAMMATPPNRDLLGDAGLLTTEGAAAGPTDLVIAVLAEDEAAARAAAGAARAALAARGPTLPGGAGLSRPRSLASAVARAPEATLALVSVPGVFAGAEARKALLAGLHVMLFSSHVPLETEIALKRLARDRGLLLMGPDCGSAIVAGVPLGFVNAVPRGRIGIAAASGTGLQEVACLIAAAGEGVSHAIGVGGRDLSDDVGGLTMQQALAALADDRSTEVIAVTGKAPGAGVARMLQAAAGRLDKPCVLHFVGGCPTPGGPAPVVATLEDLALAAVALARGRPPQPVEFTLPAAEIARLVEGAVDGLAAGQRFVRGVFAGGTLAAEARALLQAALTEVAPDLSGGGKGHRIVDLGDEAFTLGRPHPMIDGTVRREWILAEARDASTAVLLLDVILGHGAHADPAGELVPALVTAAAEARARGGALPMVASVVGTDADPQRRGAQVARLREAGVVVMPSSAQAARLAARIAARAATR